MGVVSLTAVTCLLFLLTSLGHMKQHSPADDDFAEFNTDLDEEEFDNIPVPQPKPPVSDSEKADEKKANSYSDFDEDSVVQEAEVDPALEFLANDDEFEGFDEKQQAKPGQKPNLVFTDVPQHLRTRWDGFYLEFLMLIGLISYALNFFYGRQKNQKLAYSWLESVRDVLDKNFAVVGDDGQGKEPTSGVLMKESEHIFSLWCTGRQGCQGMMIDLKLVKRQDIISLMSRLMKPQSDVIEVSVTLDDDMEPLIFAAGTKKQISKAVKNLQDLGSFCDAKKSCERFKCPQLMYVSELGETAELIFDSELQKFMQLYPDLLEYLHISDQYSGSKPDEAAGQSTPVPAPEINRVLQARFAVPGFGKCQPEDLQNMLPCLKLVIFLIDKLKRVKLSKDGRAKAEKNRLKMEEQLSKLLHAQRQENMQAKRDERVKAEKERIMNEVDPEKQRKLEDAQLRKEKRRTQSKMKSMVVRMR